MGNSEFILKSKEIVQDFYKSINKKINLEDIYCVWVCKTLQNNKALISTEISDERYIEITYNGDKKEFYVDIYSKILNKCIPND